MFSKKNLSILIAAVLVCACVVGALFIGADAQNVEYYLTVGTGSVTPANGQTALAETSFDTVTAAMVQAAAKTDWASTDSLTIYVTSPAGSEETVTDYKLFGVNSIFRSDGTLLPITITGGSGKTNGFAIPTGNIHCTNNYTFKNMALPWGVSATTNTNLRAGSAQITFDNVDITNADGEKVTTGKLFLSADASTSRAFAGWDANKWAANSVDGHLETSITLKNFEYGTSTGLVSVKETIGGYSVAAAGKAYADVRSKITLGEGAVVSNLHVFGQNSSYNGGSNNNGIAAEYAVEIQDGATVSVFYGIRNANSGKGNIVVNMTGGIVENYYMGCNATGTGTFVGNVTNNISGGEITKYFYGFRYGTLTGRLVNNISGGKFSGTVLLGGDGATISGDGTASAALENNISGGTFTVQTTAGSKSGTVASIENNISSNPTFKGQFIGGCTTGTVTGSLKNNVSGTPSFENNFFGGNHSGGSVGAIVNTISGGTFKATSYLSSRAGTVATSENKISGGTFNNGIYLGGNLANITTSLTSTVSGGTFHGRIYGLSASGTVASGSFTIKPDGNKLSIYGAVENCTNFIGNGGTVNIAGGTSISATTASGTVTFNQTKIWLTSTYFTANSGSITIKVTQDESVTGDYEIDGNTLTGMTKMLFGTSFVFNNKVSMTFYFSKAAVDATDAEGFTFVVKAEKGRVIANAALADIKASPVSGEYYTFTTSPLIASEMAYSISYEGSALPAGTLNLLNLAAQGAKMAKEAENPVLENLYLSYANYAVSVRNYLAKNAGGETWALPTPDSAPTVPEFTPGAGPLKLIDSPKITMAGRSLILYDGIVIRYYGTGPSTTASNYTLYVNNQKVSNAFTYVSGQTYPLRMDIPISVTEGERYLRITIKDANGKAHFDYVDRLDRLANDLSLVGETELGNEALYYFQSAVAYDKDVLTKTVLNSTVPTEFSAGYSTVDATPYAVGASINGDKLGVDTSEPIHVTCVAMADGKSEDTILYLSIPARKIPDNFAKNATKFLVEKTGIAEDKIFFNATHSHSAPNITAGMSAPGIRTWYNDYLYPAVIQAAQEALLDLTPATAYSGNADSDIGVGIVRRYFNSDGNFKSIQGYYRERATGTPGTYESEIDREMRTIRFERAGKDPILLINWQGHAASAVGYLLVDPEAAKVSSTDVDEAYISADFIYYLRQGLADEGYLAVFFNGGTGDINFANPPFTGNEDWITSSTKLTAAQKQEHKDRWNAFVKLTGYNADTGTFVTHVHEAFGKSLVQTALTATKSATKVNTGTIETTTIQEEVTVRKDPAQLVDSARLCKNYGTEEEGRMAYNMYGFDSGLEVTHTIKRNDTLGDTDEIPLSVVTFGDIALSFASYEMFHESASAVRAASPYKVNFVCGYTNGDDGYMPTIKGFGNQGYEHYACFYVEGTAEQCNESLLAMLEEHKN